MLGKNRHSKQHSVFPNMMAEVSDQIMVAIEDVTRVITSDPSGDELLDTCIAVGSLFVRDLNVLQFIAHHYNLDDHTRFIRYATAANEERLISHLRKMKTAIIALKGKTIAIFGFAFKEDTSDISYSPAISMGKRLYKEGCNLRIYDALVPQAIIRGVFPVVDRVTIMGKTQADMINTCHGTCALCFFTQSADMINTCHGTLI